MAKDPDPRAQRRDLPSDLKGAWFREVQEQKIDGPRRRFGTIRASVLTARLPNLLHALSPVMTRVMTPVIQGSSLAVLVPTRGRPVTLVASLVMTPVRAAIWTRSC